MVDGEAGKGDTYRPVDQARWDAAWEHIRKAQKSLRRCWVCGYPAGATPGDHRFKKCPSCGYRRKPHAARRIRPAKDVPRLRKTKLRLPTLGD
jgi:hypothetical protein